jgi:mannose-6-phosphate isomerase-like protein (cupin superfamily)
MEYQMTSVPTESFLLKADSNSLSNSPRYKDYLLQITVGQEFSDQDSFNSFCQMAISSWPSNQEGSDLVYTDFAKHLQRIENGENNTISTPWGGVDICTYEHPNVKKFLVVKKGEYLAFEKHELKKEAICVTEGLGILLYRNGNDSTCWLKLLSPGDKVSFAPGEEHCIIATEDLLVYEESIDPKGMDQDLIFLFTPDSN